MMKVFLQTHFHRSAAAPEPLCRAAARLADTEQLLPASLSLNIKQPNL